MVALEQMLDLATPWCLRVAATLRIPEPTAAGHAGIADLAAATGCDADALHAVLGHLVSQGVFIEESPGRFACNQAAEQLASVPFLDLAGIGGRMAHTWGTLLDYVRSGQPAYQQVFGRPFWEDLAAHPAIGAEFDALMGPAGHGGPDFDVELSDGWDAVRTLAAVAALGGVAADEPPRSLGIGMLVAGGKPSTLSQFTGLARQAGLDVTAARTQSSGRYVVECRPAPVTRD